MYTQTGLPISEVLAELRSALRSVGSAVVCAPPGAGKTTVVPLALLEEAWLGGRRIIMLEPRRLAARAAAYRMAELLGEEVGGTVGYRTRMDSRCGAETRIEVVTEGILTRLLQSDPSLEGFGIVIFDEFHERSLNADLGLALALDTRSALREDLRILVMSATLDAAPISGLLGGAPVITSTGRTFPVEVRYAKNPAGARTGPPSGPEFINKVADAVRNVLLNDTGDVLVFLPGGGEIRRVESALTEHGLPERVDVVPLYGELPKARQDVAIRPSPVGRRKVVLATSIAETSLTIDGVRVVVDGGLKRGPRFSPSTGMSTLATGRVTRDSAEQRAGRAGRTAPGVCVRLWTEGEQSGLTERSTPEIREADLAPLALELAAWGVRDPGTLKWLDVPPDGALCHARDLLARLGATDAEGRITEHGKEMAGIGLHPRLAHMVLEGRRLGLGGLAAFLSALLTERDVLKQGPGARDTDLRHRLEVVLGTIRTANADKQTCERVAAAAKQLIKRLGTDSRITETGPAGLLLAFAYPDRIGKRRAGARGRFLLANGRGAYLEGTELSGEEYLVAASLDGGSSESKIFLAAPVSEADLEEHFAGEIEDKEVVEWDQSAGAVSSKTIRSLRGLVLAERRIEKPSGEKVLGALVSGIRQNGLGVLPWNAASEALRARINFLSRISAETGVVFPMLTDEWLTENLEEWLGGWLEKMTRLDHLKKIDLKAVITGLLTWEQVKALERLAPERIKVPSGSGITIDYSTERPVLAVKLQEMFGAADTPAVAGGRVKLVVHLLSPAGRPLQVTEDLGGFWTNSYPLVRKDMKGRYPKHHWPDDPMGAEPSRGTGRKTRSSG